MQPEGLCGISFQVTADFLNHKLSTVCSKV